MGRGLLVDFASPESIADAVMRILGSPDLQLQLESRTRAYGQRLLWPEIGARYRHLLREVCRPLPSRPARVMTRGVSALVRQDRVQNAAQ